MALRRIRWRARVVDPGFGAPVPEGAVVTQAAAGEEQVLFAGDAGEAARRWPDAEEVDAGFALSPAPVNAHVHLDLTTMPLVRDAYPAFVRAVVAHGRAGGRGLDAARRGLDELRASGVGAFGDVVTDESVMFHLLGAADLRGVAYWEVFAPDPADAEAVFDATVERLRRFRAAERPGGVRVGLSPHAPHSVSAPLLTRLAALARANDLPMQVHVAESPAETRLHRHGDGPLRELFGPALAGWRPSGRSPVRYLADLGVLEAAPTLVHAVEVDEDDVRAIGNAGCAVVHCPRSNASLGCGRFPWETYARHGVTVGLGTDGRGSAASLDIEDEVAAAVRMHGPRAHPAALVRAAVVGGQRALRRSPPRLTRGSPASRMVRWRSDPTATPSGGGATSDA